MVSGIRVIKMHVWEARFKEMLDEARRWVIACLCGHAQLHTVCYTNEEQKLLAIIEFEFNMSSCEIKCLKAQMHMYNI